MEYYDLVSRPRFGKRFYQQQHEDSNQGEGRLGLLQRLIERIED